tara:strand:- start:47 stop:412 length:366 start_codon:yes stop_codon:yes gene_type:complete
MAISGAFNGATISIGGSTFSMTNWKESSDDRAAINTTIASDTRKTEVLGQAGVKQWTIELLYDVDSYATLQTLYTSTSTSAMVLTLPGESATVTGNGLLKSLEISGEIDGATTVTTVWSVA